MDMEVKFTVKEKVMYELTVQKGTEPPDIYTGDTPEEIAETIKKLLTE